MKTLPINYLPNILLKRQDLKDDLCLALRRTGVPSRNLPDYVGQILTQYSFKIGRLYIVLPYFHHIIDEDSRTLRNFLKSARIHDLDLVQLLSLAMQAVDLEYAQFVTKVYMEYEKNIYDDDVKKSDQLGYLPRN